DVERCIYKQPRAGVVVKLLEPFELADHRAARRDRDATVALGTRTLPKDRGKAGLGGGLFARIVRSGDDQLADDLACAHEAVVGDTATIGIAQEERAGLGYPRRVSRPGGSARGEEECGGSNNWHRAHGKLQPGCLPVEHQRASTRFRLESSAKEELSGRIRDILGAKLRQARQIIRRSNGSRTTDSRRSI